MSGYKRIQFNAMLKPIEGVNVTQVRNAMVPILWVEEVCILYSNIISLRIPAAILGCVKHLCGQLISYP